MNQQKKYDKCLTSSSSSSTNLSGSSSHDSICEADGCKKIITAGIKGGTPTLTTSRKAFFSRIVAKKSKTAITVP